MYLLCPEITPRLEYISRFIITDLLGIPLQITDMAEQIPDGEAVLNYRREAFPHSFHMPPVELLFQTGIQDQDLWVADWKGYPVFFLCPPEADIPFDVLAASFYMVSSYGEYFPQPLDEFGRFSAENSMAYLNRFHDRPVVNLWARCLLQELQKRFPDLKARPRTYEFRSTIDVDQPYAFVGKGVLRNTGGLLRDFRKGRKETVRLRIRAFLHRQKDPFDTFAYLERVHRKFGLKPLYFLSVGKHSDYDKNPKPTQSRYKKLIQKLAREQNIGLHPSFRSVDQPEYLRIEKEKLEQVSEQQIKRSRQHFLRLRFPMTYRNLIENGFTEDYTMGFAREPGFRAGIAAPYLWYDLQEEKQTSLRVFPFVMMDGTLRDYKRLTPANAKEVASGLINEVKSVGGLLMLIWHNSSLAAFEGWNGWKNVFEFILDEASN